MHHLVVSFTHKNTDIATRERLAFDNDLAKEQFIQQILATKNIYEVVLLSTCNRVEVICCAKEIDDAVVTIINNLALHSGILPQELELICDLFKSQSAIHHLFMVASSLDSLVVGETQIAGQLKEAFKFSSEKGYCFEGLSRAIHFSFKCAAKVRSITNIGSNPVSVASAAVAKAKNLAQVGMQKALVIGAGEMSELTIKHLLKHKFEVTLVSRNIKKAKLLADAMQAEVGVEEYGMLETLLHTHHFLFSATSAPYPIITRAMVRECEFQRFWFDIAVPRDIEDFQNDKIAIFAVDDLRDIVDEHILLRAEEAKQAYKIVAEMTTEFYQWMSNLEIEPLIKQIHVRAQAIAQKKIRHALKKSFIRSEDLANIEKLTQSVLSDFLNTPIRNIRKICTQKCNDEFLETFVDVFDLDLGYDNHSKEEM